MLLQKGVDGILKQSQPGSLSKTLFSYVLNCLLQEIQMTDLSFLHKHVGKLDDFHKNIHKCLLSLFLTLIFI